MKSKAFPYIASILLIFIFTYTASGKLMDMYGFQSVLSTSPLIADHSVLVSWLVPIGELIISLLLLWSRTRLLGLACSLVSIMIFTIYIIYMIIKVPDLPCSCGGFIGSMSWRTHVLFNIALCSISLSGIMVMQKATSLKPKV